MHRREQKRLVIRATTDWDQWELMHTIRVRTNDCGLVANEKNIGAESASGWVYYLELRFAGAPVG